MGGSPQLLIRMSVFIDSLPITNYPLPLQLPIPDDQFLWGARPEM
jgi:hypothetical protein